MDNINNQNISTLYSNGGIIHGRQWYDMNHELHRINDPAIIRYYKSGEIKEKIWMKHGAKHRLDGPAEIKYNKSEVIWKETWYINNIKIINHPINWPLNKEQIIEMKLTYI